MRRILVVEDEDTIREFVVLNLRRVGYDVVDVPSGEAAQEAFEAANGDFDVALLDVMMPGIDGFTLCKWLRERSRRLGIIMLTARTQEMDRVSGLMLGADDYVTKPFGTSELLARVDAVYRRVEFNSPQEEKKPAGLSSGPFKLDDSSRMLLKNDAVIDLTQLEYLLMQQFLLKPGYAFERTELLHAVWGEDYTGDPKVVDVNIRRLRMKVEDEPSNPKYITTVWGYGYKWVE